MTSKLFTQKAGLEQPGALSATPPVQRFAYIDNLRWLVIVLVISMHAADTYSPLGNWYYVERPPLDILTLLFFAAWQMYLQSFFMGLLFFIAGVFTVPSIDRKGPGQFVRDRAFRLGLPVLFYMFGVGPITEYYVAHSWSAPHSFAHEWWHHIADLEVLQENGPLWFCLALLIFSAVYAALRQWRSSAPGPAREIPPPLTGALISLALAMASGRFLIRLVLPGVTVLNLHLGDFAQYILLFSAGIMAARNHWLPKLSVSLSKRWVALVLPVGFTLWLATLAFGTGPEGNRDLPSEGWHWQSGALSLWESFTCVTLCLGSLTLFREKLNTQGRLARFLSDNAFSVFVFHPPFVILGARLLHGLPLVPLAKFVVLTGLAVSVTYALSALVFRRIPYLRAIL